MQDHLDGGITLLIRCPGSDIPSNLAAENITVDLYITPRELVGNECVSGNTAMIVQAFCREFALPHLQRFTERCKVESIMCPKSRREFVLDWRFVLLTSVQRSQNLFLSRAQVTFLP